jgi:hypothetical protein
MSRRESGLSKSVDRALPTTSGDSVMAKKRKPIVLEKLAKDSGDLATMLTELDDKSRRDRSKATSWNRRFTACGKGTPAPAPKIRLA